MLEIKRRGGYAMRYEDIADFVEEYLDVVTLWGVNAMDTPCIANGVQCSIGDVVYACTDILAVETGIYNAMVAFAYSCLDFHLTNDIAVKEVIETL